MIVLIGFKERDPSVEETEVVLIKGFSPGVAEGADQMYGEGNWRIAHIDEQKQEPWVFETKTRIEKP